MSLEPNSQLGRYRIISLLGRGGMGEVYLAEDTKLERTVALKVLPPDVSNNQQRMNRFAREARAASSLNHPNVAHIYEIEVTDSPCYIAMEYIKGETLREHLVKTRLTLHEALDIAVQATRAVAAAHAAGIIHRDIKTENIMISRDGYVKVLDFGLAKLIEPTEENPDPAALTVTSAQTDPGVVMGTFSYMSPEQARGLAADARTDLWGLGVVIYEMVAGQLPFTGGTASDLLSSILKDEPPPLARFARDVPEALEWIVAKALTKETEGRYQTAKELLTDLQRLKNRLGAEAEIERSMPPEYRISRSSFAGASQSPFRVSTASSTHAPVTNSVHPQSNAEYIASGIKRHKSGAIVVLTLFMVVAGATAIFFLKNRATQSAALTSSPQHRQMGRVTSDAGLQIGATWSADARLVAYSSDRSGNFDIWVQSLGGGNPIQVTHHPAHDWQPDWSPDGNNIVFRSERDGGGIYVVPAFGGNERKVSSFGYRPQWSPDGSKILFLEPGLRMFDFPKVYFLMLDGQDNTPHEIATSISGTETGIRENSVAWHPDGKRISFMNMDGTFWTVAITGGAPVKSEIAPKVESQLKEADVELSNFRWARSGKFLYFEGTSRGVSNIWRVTVEPDTLRWIDGPERLTTDNEQDTNLAVSADGKRLAYTISKQTTRIWLFPFDSNAGQVKGQGQPVTDIEVEASFADLSPDGKKLAFISHMYGMGRQELHVKSLVDKQDNVLAADDNYRYYPRWSPDSTRLAYSRFHSIDQQISGEVNPPFGTTKAGPIVMLDTRHGDEQLITSQGQWLDYMYDWSPDGEWILASTNRASPERWQICLFPLRAAPHAEDEMRVVASDPENSLWTPRFSPDGRWICYIAQKAKEANTSVIYVVPSQGGTPARITRENGWCDWPRWSQDGKTIYFISNYNSSFLNVWGIHFDPLQGVATGEPFRVTNFESPGQMIFTKIAFTEMAINKNRLALPVTDVSGSIWMLENVDH